MTDTRPVLLTVSGQIPADLDEAITAGQRPRADYRVMQDTFDADIVDEQIALAATGRFGGLLRRFAGVGPLLAWYCFRNRRDYEVIVTDGEQVGLPLAILDKFARGACARHMMIVHILSVPKKERLIRLTRIASNIDCYVVYCSWQADFIRDRLGVHQDKILPTTFMVDTAFFTPDSVAVPRRRMICSAGLERRDYPTLIQAVDGLDVEVTVAAASPWSKQHDSTTEVVVPDNVEIKRFDLFELRELYASSSFVVMPLYDVDFQAGITTILEAMSMARPVVCTRTPGQTDTITDDVTGIYVGIGDVAELRQAIIGLLEDAERTERLGRQAREWVVAQADVVVYAERLAERVEALRAPPLGPTL